MLRRLPRLLACLLITCLYLESRGAIIPERGVNTKSSGFDAYQRGRTHREYAGLAVSFLMLRNDRRAPDTGRYRMRTAGADGC